MSAEAVNPRPASTILLLRDSANTTGADGNSRGEIAELKKRGVEFEGPPQKQPWGTYAMFKDSEGNRFVLSSD